MTERIFIGAAEAAQLLELPSADAFKSRRAALERDHGFPPPVPWAASPLRWRRADVIAWRDNYYKAPDLAPALGPGRGDAARRVVMLGMARAS